MNIKWILKQLLPLKYKTKFRKNNKIKFCEWRMWLGKPFNIQWS